MTSRDSENWYKEQTFDWQNYGNSRPVYRKELFDTVFAYHEANGGRYDGVACDFGTGNGTLLPELLKRFSRVYASDVNEPQLDELRQIFAQDVKSGKLTVHAEAAGDSNSTSIADGEADLFVAGMAAQWFDRPKWYAQAARKLKPGGTLCFWNYAVKPFIYTHPDAEDALLDLHRYSCRGAEELCKTSARILEVGVLDHTLMRNVVSPSQDDGFTNVKRHYWHLDGKHAEQWQAPQSQFFDKKFKEEFANFFVSRIREDEQIIKHDGSNEQPTLLVHDNWTVKHLMGYFVSLSAPGFDPTTEEWATLWKTFEEKVGGPDAQFGLAWPLTAIIASRK